MSDLRDQYHITEDDIEHSRNRVRGMLPKEFRRTATARRMSMMSRTSVDSVRVRTQRLDSTLEESGTDYSNNTMYRLRTVPTPPDGHSGAGNTNNSASGSGSGGLRAASGLRVRPRLNGGNSLSDSRTDSLELDDGKMDMFAMSGMPSPPVDYEEHHF